MGVGGGYEVCDSVAGEAGEGCMWRVCGCHNACECF